MFISPAYAQSTTTATGGGSFLSLIIPFALVFAIMYFLIIRPQRQKMKQHQELISNIRRGDTIVTTGGIVGKVAKVIDANEIEVEIARDVRVRFARAAVQEVRAKGEPVKEETEAE